MEMPVALPEDYLAQLASKYYLPELSPNGHKWLDKNVRSKGLPVLLKKNLVQSILLDRSRCGNIEDMVEVLTRYSPLAIYFTDYQTIKSDY